MANSVFIYPGNLQEQAGQGTQQGGVPCVIYTNVTPASNVSTGETVLMTYTLPANTLSATGQAVRIRGSVVLAANSNTKITRVYFGASLVTAVVTTSSAGVALDFEAVVFRTGAATQYGMGKMIGATGTTSVVNDTRTTSPTETLSGALTIKLTGQSGTASNDVTANAFFVDWLPSGV